MAILSNKIYTASFTGHYPVGTAAVIVARDIEHARELLAKQMEAHELKPSDAYEATITRLAIHKPKCTILCDGNY